MPVIPFPQRHRSREPAPVRPLQREARIHGTFRSPSGGLGTMTGWMRRDRFHVVSDRLCAGVFTGELHDSEGATVGVCRRRTVPAEVTRSVRPLGLSVSIPAFARDTGVGRRPLLCDLVDGLDNHQAEAAPAPARATAPRPGLVPAIAPVVAPVAPVVALKRRYLGFVLEDGQRR